MKKGSLDNEAETSPDPKNASGRSRAFNSQATKSLKATSYTMPGRWRRTLWLCFPFLILAAVAGGLYLGFKFAYNAKDDVFEKEAFTELDVRSADAPEEFLERYAVVNDNTRGTQNLSQQEEIQYTGVLTLKSGRYLFRFNAKSMKESEVNFLSERANFNFSYDAKGMTFAPVGVHEPDHHAFLANLSLELSHILGGFVNPINAVIAEPESYVIKKLSRVVWNGEPCLEVKVVSAANPNATSTAYIHERTMETIGVRCDFFAGDSRSYRFSSNPNDDNHFMPDEIQFTSNEGGTLNVQLTNIRFPQTIL